MQLVAADSTTKCCGCYIYVEGGVGGAGGGTIKSTICEACTEQTKDVCCACGITASACETCATGESCKATVVLGVGTTKCKKDE